jgi:hypothetical protein
MITTHRFGLFLVLVFALLGTAQTRNVIAFDVEGGSRAGRSGNPSLRIRRVGEMRCCICG